MSSVKGVDFILFLHMAKTTLGFTIRVTMHDPWTCNVRLQWLSLLYFSQSVMKFINLLIIKKYLSCYPRVIASNPKNFKQIFCIFNRMAECPEKPQISLFIYFFVFIQIPDQVNEGWKEYNIHWQSNNILDKRKEKEKKKRVKYSNIRSKL